MFDKMVFSANIPDTDIRRIAESNHLQRCTEGIEEYWQSTQYGNFEGIYIRIKRGKLTIKCSLHKIFYKAEYGKLDNSRLFTLNDALSMIITLFEMLKVDRKIVKVTYYEIGLNLPVEDDPLSYIEMMGYIGRDKERKMFNDPNYDEDRQHITEKKKNIKKILKAYDKGHEMRTKGKEVEQNILRIETIYRRQSIPLLSLTSHDYLVKVTNRFYRDWITVDFPKRIIPDKGMKSSQITMAVNLMNIGREGYYKANKLAYKNREITKKQWETIRVFIHSWDTIKERFRFVPGEKETDYRKSLSEIYQLATF
ncbi:MAG: hypothetical protein LKI39_02570 [Bacteroides sp.]|jgi:hypothetical protein|nr:hypothetical protein [Bacteroides sp.]